MDEEGAELDDEPGMGYGEILHRSHLTRCIGIGTEGGFKSNEQETRYAVGKRRRCKCAEEIKQNIRWKKSKRCYRCYVYQEHNERE